MGLEELREEILRKARDEAKELEEKAGLESERIIKGAKDERKRILAGAKESANALVEAERRERIAAARLDARNLIGKAKDELIEDSLVKIWEYMKEYTKSKAYDDFLRKVIMRGMKEIGKECTICVRREDVENVKKMFPKADVETAGTSIAGGVIVKSKDGRIRANYSLEAIFEENSALLRRKILDILGGKNAD
ncbi:MAG: V-type ATP synthase subunit E [Candidatus Micrarchaeia archaeon]